MTAGAIAAVVAASERRIARQLRESGAVTPENAASFEPRRRIDARRLQHLIRAGVVVEAAPGLYWLNEAAYAARRRRRHAVLMTVLGLVVVGLIIAWLTQAFN